VLDEKRIEESVVVDSYYGLDPIVIFELLVDHQALQRLALVMMNLLHW
jgi:hypothetical protein